MNDFDDLDDLDEVLGPLRSAATPAELAHETATVDLMVKAHRTSEENHMFTSRRARIATLVAAGVLGFGGMAAASPSLLGDEPVENEPVVVEVDEEPVESIEPVEEQPAEEPVEEEPVEEEPVEEEPAEEPVEPVEDDPAEPADAAADAVLVDDPATAFDETTCLPGNHGATVSAVARGLFPGDVSVTDAAQSSCGKTGKLDDDDADTEDEPDTESATETEPAVATDRPGGRDKTAGDSGPGQSNGKAGNGNGKSGNGNGKGSSGKRGG